MSSDPFRRTCLIPYANPDSLPPLLREKLNILPFRRNILYTVAQSRGLGPHFLGLIGACFDGGQRSLPELDWQLIVLRVAKNLDCKYEWDVNVPVAEVHGMPREKIKSIGRTLEDGKGPWTERDRILIRLVDEQLARYTNKEETVRQALGILNEGELVEVLIVIGVYAVLARLIKGLRVDDDPPIRGLKDLIRRSITATE
ncbi:hypothetical protein P170DRAFT_504726 [Aspergillus steynii IBT 23096]|uniref:Carboxymuconolactone decarboxylase-like domain-containing protein n=1 Tax=Aspergillus steynii IBT 23096 TaxID=1392250 RepID=A0A2I2GLR2_9EURO|nr:uncharacterized protein P170DRAFT_504726 [Aspergillus steynii IBT 23096]PLB53812.1 hypothetical protein P170DRAFT_504726 [Aspergillus steynii IBT 23096]